MQLTSTLDHGHGKITGVRAVMMVSKLVPGIMVWYWS